MSEGGVEGGAGLIWCPFANHAEAEHVARQLVDEKLVACANILPQITSVFRYQGTVETAGEVVVLFKTDVRLLESACARVQALHSYAAPAICAWAAEGTPAPTNRWLAGLLDEGAI